MGDEGTCVVLLRTSGVYEDTTLDACLPPDHGDSPANGGWFSSPKGWLLLLEGLDSDVDPWLGDLAARLSDAGVTGTLTGAGVVAPPVWAWPLDFEPGLSASIGFRPRPGYVLRGGGWAPGTEERRVAVAAAVDWLTAHASVDLRVFHDLTASLKAGPAAAAVMLARDLDRHGLFVATGYDKPRQEVRVASGGRPAQLNIRVTSPSRTWQDLVAELRAALLAARLDLMSVASISHRNVDHVFYEGSGDYFDWRTYESHPEVWDRFVLDPAGVQILTDAHLEAAADLSGWRTTRLDGDHSLVEARDLEPWYGGQLQILEELPDGLLRQARQDFGAMILTFQTASDLGLTR